VSKRKRLKEQIKKHLKKKENIVDFCLCFFVIIIPMIGIFLYAFGLPVSKLAFGVYASVMFSTVGILFIIFAVKEKFGYGKEGYYYSRFFGFKWLSKKEGKESTCVFGCIMIALGIFFGVLTVIKCF